MTQRHVVALTLAVAACGGGGPKVALRYHPPTGAVYHFGVEQHTTVSADSGPLAKRGRQTILMRLYFTQTVKGPVSGGTEVEVLFETITMEIPGVPSSITGAALAGLQGLHGTLVIDELGKVVRSAFDKAPGVSPEMAKRIAAGVNLTAFGFPEGRVGRGDSWTITSELPLDDVPGIVASTTEVARTRLTVREVRVEGPDTSVVLNMKTEFPSQPIHLASAEESGTLRLEGGTTGHQLFSISRGAVVDGTVKGTMKMNMSASRLGPAGMSMQIENENSIVLLPDK
jgi:hypothetical protein